MSIRLSELKADVRKVTFDYDGSEINVEYKPSAITPIFQSKMRKMDTSDAMNMVEAVSVMLVSWDVLGDNGKPIAITTNTLGTLPIAFVSKVITSVFEDMQPEAREKKD